MTSNGQQSDAVNDESARVDTFPLSHKPLREAVAEFNKAELLKIDKGTLEMGLDCFDRAIAIDPEFQKAYYYKAQWLLELGRDSDALAIADTIIVRFANWPFSYMHKALVLLLLKREEDAQAPMEMSLQMIEDSLRTVTNTALRARFLTDRAIAKKFLGVEDAAWQLRQERDFLLWQYAGDTLSVDAFIKEMENFSPKEMVPKLLKIRRRMTCL